MSDYTPTTEEVRDHFSSMWFFVKSDGDVEHNTLELEDMFDRWLAAVEAEVRADEREQAAHRVSNVLQGEHKLLLTLLDATFAAARGEDPSHE